MTKTVYLPFVSMRQSDKIVQWCDEQGFHLHREDSVYGFGTPYTVVDGSTAIAFKYLTDEQELLLHLKWGSA